MTGTQMERSLQPLFAMSWQLICDWRSGFTERRIYIGSAIAANINHWHKEISCTGISLWCLKYRQEFQELQLSNILTNGIKAGEQDAAMDKLSGVNEGAAFVPRTLPPHIGVVPYTRVHRRAVIAPVPGDTMPFLRRAATYQYKNNAAM